MNPFSPNTESLNIYTISIYYTWSGSGFTHTFPRRAIDLGPYADWLCPERIYLNVERAYREFRSAPFDQPWYQAKSFDEVYGVALARGISPTF